MNNTVQKWFENPEFQKLPFSTKQHTLSNYFDEELTNEKFYALPKTEQTRVRNNFVVMNMAPHMPEAPERGWIGDIGSALAGGVLGAAETGLRVARTVGDVFVGEEPEEEEWTTRGLEKLEDIRMSSPFLRPSKEARSGVRRWVYEGLQSTVQSILAQGPATAVGFLAGGAPGAIAMYALSGGSLYGVAARDEFLERADARGIDRKASEPAALKYALAEGGFEFATDLLEAATAGVARPFTRTGKTALKNGIKALLKQRASTIAARVGGVATAETIGEMATAGTQAEIAHGIDLGDERFWSAAKNAFGPSLVAGLIFGGMGAGINTLQRRGIQQSLVNPETDKKKRMQAVVAVGKELNSISPDIARVWTINAAEAVQDKKPISMDEDLVEISDVKDEVSKNAPMGTNAQGVTEIGQKGSLEKQRIKREQDRAAEEELATDAAKEIVETDIKQAKAQESAAAEATLAEANQSEIDRIWEEMQGAQVEEASEEVQPASEDELVETPGEVEITKRLKELEEVLSPGQISFIQNKVGQLGSPETVAAEFNADDNVSEYANLFAWMVDNEARKIEKTKTTEQKPTDAKAIQGDLLRGPGIDDLGKVKTKIRGESEKGKGQVYSYSSTQVNLPEKEAEDIKNFAAKIPESEIYTDPEDPTYGREDNPHITVKYGLHTVNPKDVEPLLKDAGPIKAKMGEVSIFENDDFDVVKVDIESPELHALNKKISDNLKVTDTYPDYKPHATIAYVKKGEGKKYVGDKSFEGKEIVFDSLVFSGKDGKEVEIALGGKSTPSKSSDTKTLQPDSAIAPESDYIERDKGEVRSKRQADEGVVKIETEKQSFKGKSAKTYLNDNTEIDTQYAVIDINSLVTSHTNDLNPDKNFPSELQPRDRSRDAMRLQIEEIANKLNPERLGDSTSVSSGAPIIGPDMVVESGNGRTIAIRKAYDKETGEKYRKWLEENALKFGLRSEDIKAIGRPVLVRVRKTDVDRVDFARRANQDEIARLSPVEIAKNDAERLTDGDLSVFKPSEDGDITATSNSTFISRFLSGLGTNESAGYLTSDGRYTKQLIDRIQAAVFYKAYGDDTLLTLTAEEANPDIKNILNALNIAAPHFIKAKAINANLGGLDIPSHIIAASKLIRQSRKHGESVETILSQIGIFEQIPEDTKVFSRFINDNIRSAKRMGLVFREAAKGIRDFLLEKKNKSLFGERKLALSEVIENAIEKVERKYYGKAQQKLNFKRDNEQSGRKGERGRDRRAETHTLAREPAERRQVEEKGRVTSYETAKEQESYLEEPKGNLKVKFKRPKQQSFDFSFAKKSNTAVKTIPPFRQRTRMATTGDISASGNVVRNVDDAAALLAHIRKSAQEIAYTVVTDKDGIVREIHKYSKGGKDSSIAVPYEIAGRAMRVPGADTLYFIHNHPSGSLDQSKQDIAISSQIKKLLGLKDIKTASLVIGGTSYLEIDETGAKQPQKIRPTIRKTKLPVKERYLIRSKNLEDTPSINNPDEAIKRIKSDYTDAEGFLFLDVKNKDIGFLPYPEGKTLKEASAIFIKEAEKLNAKSFIFNSKKSLSRKNRDLFLKSIIKELHQQIALLDIVENGKSLVNAGRLQAFQRDAAIAPGFTSANLGEVVYSTKAWHGGPYKFDKFSTDKVGTGEGAQGFGYGLYFTDEEEVARYYADKLGSKFLTINGKQLGPENIRKEYRDALNGVEKYKWPTIDSALNQIVRELGQRKTSKQLLEEYRRLSEEFEELVTQAVYDILKNNTIQPSRNLYRVTLHKGKDPSEYNWLDWYEPVSKNMKLAKKIEQQFAQEKIQPSVMFDRLMDLAKENSWSAQWQSIYFQLSKMFGSEKEASLFLLRADIDGIKYPAGTLSGVESDAFNYVVFDENAVTIEDHVQYASSQTPPQSTGITNLFQVNLNSIKSHPRFKTATVTQGDDGIISVRFKNDLGFTINSIDSVDENSVTLNADYGRYGLKPGEKVAGFYDHKDKNITIVEGVGDRYTIDHEFEHFLEKSGVLTPMDIEALNREVEKIGLTPNEETRARYLEEACRNRDAQTSHMARIVQKVIDFIDMIINQFQRTARGVLRDIESGKIGDHAALGDKINEFAQSSAYSVKEAVKKITDNPRFVKWFGDSMVVDENGEPLVVYHGTTMDFTAFDPAKRGTRTGLDARHGFFFAGKPEIASEYAKEFGKDAKGGQVMPVYLSLQNPLQVDYKSQRVDHSKLEKVIKFAKQKGHDGVVVHNIKDGAIEDNQYVAFDPHQIKSIFNKGDFDPDNPDILYSTKEHVTYSTGLIPSGPEVARDIQEDRSFANRIFEQRDVAVHRAQVEVQDLQKKVQALAGKKSRRRHPLGFAYDKRLQRSRESDALDMALMVWRDLQINPDKADEFKTWADGALKDPETSREQKLSIKRQLSLLDRALNLTDEQKALVDEIGELFDKAYTVAKANKVVSAFRDNYVRRIWKVPKSKEWHFFSSGSTGYGFKTFTTARMQRKLETIIDGWMAGYELGIKGLTNSYGTYMQELETILANKDFIVQGYHTRDIEGLRLFSTSRKGKYSDYVELKAPGFKVWEWAGKVETEVEPDEEGALLVDDYGRKFFYGAIEKLPETWAVYKVQDGKKSKKALRVFESKEDAEAFASGKDYETSIEYRSAKEFAEAWEERKLYAPKPLADIINKMTASDRLFSGIPGLDAMARFNAGMKSWILLSSFFHHMAGARSWVFGVHHGWKKKKAKNPITGAMIETAGANPVAAYKAGLKKIEDRHAIIELGVKNGLTLGEMQDWSERALRKETGFAETLANKLGLERTSKVMERGRFFREKFTDSLFKKYFAGLKAEAFTMEFIHELQKVQDAWTQGKGKRPDIDAVAERTARLINADFGGLHLQRMGRNPTVQKMARLLLLAPDWTESNFRTVTGMIPGLNKWINRIIGDVPGPAGMDKIYRKFWGRVALRIAVSTVLSQMLLNGADDSEDFWKEQALSNRFNKYRWTEVDVSKIYHALGIDTESTRKTLSLGGHFFDPLKLFDPASLIKHKASPAVRVAEAVMSGSDWAERPFTGVKALFGTRQTIKKSPHEKKEGFYSRLPATVVNQVTNLQPVQVRYFLRYLQGEQDGLTAILRSMGTSVHTAWPAKITTPIAKGDGEDRMYEAVKDLMDKGMLHMGPPAGKITVGGILRKLTRKQYQEYIEKSSELARVKLQATILSSK